jgi:hypothetical protein
VNEFERKRSWPNFKVLSRHFSGGPRKTTKNPSQDSRSLGQDLNPGAAEYEAEVLTSRPRRSVPKQKSRNIGLCFYIV